VVARYGVTSKRSGFEKAQSFLGILDKILTKVLKVLLRDNLLCNVSFEFGWHKKTINEYLGSQPRYVTPANFVSARIPLTFYCHGVNGIMLFHGDSPS
jgi:hypothetical protein